MNFILKLKLPLILITALIARLISILYFRDLLIVNEWSILLENLENNKVLSVHSVNGEPVPNIFMPPLYPLFLYFLKIIFSDFNQFLWSIQFSQLIFSLLAVYLANKILLEFFSQNMSALGTFIFAIFPLNVYAVSQVSSITLQVLLLNIFLYSFIRLFKGNNNRYIFLFSISSGALMLIRGEFFIFVILSIIYLFLNDKNIKKVLLVSLLSVLVISPYLYRNFEIFGVITITKSSGYNLLKGNHPNTKVEGTPMFLKVGEVVPEVKLELQNLSSKGPSQTYDLSQDKILLNQAIKFIKEDPKKYIILYFQKFFSFMFFDLNASYRNYYSIAHIVPKILLAISTLAGIILSFKLKLNIVNYISLYYFANLGLFSFFFILPRYSLSLLIIQVILSLFVLKKIKPSL